jgi:hypothetical protein
MRQCVCISLSLSVCMRVFLSLSHLFVCRRVRVADRVGVRAEITCEGNSYGLATWPTTAAGLTALSIAGVCDAGYTAANAAAAPTRQCLPTGTYAPAITNPCVRTCIQTDRHRESERGSERGRGRWGTRPPTRHTGTHSHIGTGHRP